MTNRSVVMSHAECGTLIAAVPFMLRFVPTASLIVVGFTGTSPCRATFTMRVDLPAPNNYSAALGALRDPISRQEPDAMAVIVVGGNHRDAADDYLPHRELVQGCAAIAENLGLSLMSSLWVAAIEAYQAWFSYTEPGRFGTVPEPRTSAVGLESVVVGEVTYDNRAGTITLVAGGKAGQKVGGVVEPGFKSGLYVTFDTDGGVRDVGWRVGPSVTTGLGGFEASAYNDEMDLSFLPRVDLSGPEIT